MPLSKARMRERKRLDRGNVKPMSNLSAEPDVKPNKATLEELRGIIRGIESNKPVKPREPYIQPYVRGRQYTPGTKVMYRGQVHTVPEVDADGYAMQGE